LTLHPSVYAELLKKKIERHGSNVFLVNTGWSGGPYGVGERMSIDTTRACVRSILDGSIHNMTFETDAIFGFSVPESLPSVPKEICSPRMSWENSKEYDLQAEILANMFDKNFEKYNLDVDLGRIFA
jgi:phosphoenolpyruvate carboxykinase (ATP)